MSLNHLFIFSELTPYTNYTYFYRNTSNRNTFCTCRCAEMWIIWKTLCQSMIIILYWLHHLVTSPSYWVHPPVCLVSSGPSVQIETLSQSVSRLECGPLVPPARSMNLCRAELVMARSRSRPRQEMMLTSASVSSYIIGHWPHCYYVA